VGVAVGEGQGPDPLRHPDGDELGDGTPAVVAHQIDGVEVQSVEEGDDHLGLTIHGQAAVGRERGLPVGQQVDGQAGAQIGQAGEQTPPEIGVEKDAVDEEGVRPVTRTQVGDVARSSRRSSWPWRNVCWPK